ncbi:MAG: FAD-containing oxidoreductase, partial [Pirellulales bacterium]|nr:FAD-containing oxidoreductase [Pirellulales bacterium]
VGATIVAAHAGEMIGEITLLMTQKKGRLGDLGATIHSYPTQVEVLKRIADSYARTALTPTVKKWFKRYLAWRR